MSLVNKLNIVWIHLAQPDATLSVPQKDTLSQVAKGERALYLLKLMLNNDVTSQDDGLNQVQSFLSRIEPLNNGVECSFNSNLCHGLCPLFVVIKWCKCGVNVRN